MPKPWSAETKRWVIAGSLIFGALVLYRVRGVAIPLAIAILIAYVLNPLAGLLKRARLSRTGATIIIYLLLIFVLIATSGFIAPLVQQIMSIDVDFLAISRGFQELMARYQEVEFFGFTIDLYRVFGDVQGELARLVGSIASQSINIFRGAASSVLWMVFVLVTSFYLLKDAEKIASYGRGLIPPEYKEEVGHLMKEIGDIWNSFLRGQIILSTIVGFGTGAAMWALGVKNALLLGILAGILEIVPSIGPILAAIPAVALAFFQGSQHLALTSGWFAILVTGLYVVIQQVENNFLVPRIMGRSVNLHPVVVIVAAIGGAMMGGIVGIFLAVPVLGSARILGGYLYDKLLLSEEGEAAPSEITAQAEALSEEEKQEGQDHRTHG